MSICIYMFVSQETQDNQANLRGPDHTGAEQETLQQQLTIRYEFGFLKGLLFVKVYEKA